MLQRDMRRSLRLSCDDFLRWIKNPADSEASDFPGGTLSVMIRESPPEMCHP